MIINFSAVSAVSAVPAVPAVSKFSKLTKEIKEVREIREMVSRKTLNSLNSLNPLNSLFTFQFHLGGAGRGGGVCECEYVKYIGEFTYSHSHFNLIAIFQEATAAEEDLLITNY